MKHMDKVIAIRREGMKPGAVYVQMGPALPESGGLGHGEEGIVTVRIEDDDTIDLLDFRPLRGLMVCCEDFGHDREWHRALTKAIAAVEPAYLWMPIWKDGKVVLIHTRTAGKDGAPAISETLHP